jgi:uncharacterized protein DUF5615
MPLTAEARCDFLWTNPRVRPSQIGFPTRDKVCSVYEQARGLDDDAIIQKAFSENWILITNDKDFGEKVYRERRPDRGVVLLRLEDERAIIKIETYVTCSSVTLIEFRINFWSLPKNEFVLRGDEQVVENEAQELGAMAGLPIP